MLVVEQQSTAPLHVLGCAELSGTIEIALGGDTSCMAPLTSVGRGGYPRGALVYDHLCAEHGQGDDGRRRLPLGAREAEGTRLTGLVDTARASINQSVLVVAYELSDAEMALASSGPHVTPTWPLCADW